VSRRIAGLALALALLHLSTGCGGQMPEQRTTPDGRTILSLQLNWFPEPEFGGFYEAKRTGRYRDADLEVTVLAGGPSVPAVPLVASGRAHFGIAGADEVVAARAQEVPIVALFAVYQTSPQGIMVHASSGITDLAEVFAPRTPKLTLALMNEPYVNWLRRLYDFSNVTPVIYQGGVSQFVHNEHFAQQCFVTAEPFTADAAGATARAFLVADSGFNPYAGVVIAREDYVAEHEATVRAFLESTRRGWADYLQDPEPTNALMLPLNPGESAATFAKAAVRQTELIRSDAGLGTMTVARWQRLIDQMVEIDEIDEPIDAAHCFRALRLAPVAARAAEHVPLTRAAKSDGPGTSPGKTGPAVDPCTPIT